MDFFTIVILMLAVYLIPELLRKRKPREYKYPDIPESNRVKVSKFPEPIMEPPTYAPNPVSHESVSKISEAYTVTGLDDSKSAWQGNLNEPMIINGLIFAEILSPPLAKRKSNLTNRFYGFKSLK